MNVQLARCCCLQFVEQIRQSVFFLQWLDAKVMMGVLNYRDYIEYIFHLIGKSGSQSVDSKSGKSRFT